MYALLSPSTPIVQKIRRHLGRLRRAHCGRGAARRASGASGPPAAGHRGERAPPTTPQGSESYKPQAATHDAQWEHVPSGEPAEVKKAAAGPKKD